MADENAGDTGKFLDDLVARAKGVGGQVREFTEDAFDHVREFSATAGENLKGFATDAGDNLRHFATGAGDNLRGLANDAGDNLKHFANDAGDNFKHLAAGAREKGQQAFDDLRGRIDGSTRAAKEAAEDSSDGTADEDD